MKILNFGSCNIDFAYSLDHIVCEGETETSDRLDVFSGGKGLNQSVALARSGAQVYHAGCVGNDGDFLLDVLKSSGVNTTYLKRLEDEKCGHAIIQVSRSGENCIFLYGGANHRITEEQIDNVLENFSKGDILLTQNETNQLETLIKKAYDKGMCIILNPSPMNEVIHKLDLSQISYLVLNQVEAKAITGCDTTDEALNVLLKKYPEQKIVLTLGSKGCVYVDAEQKIFHPSFVTKAVDTTGAGDTFTGYFVGELARGESVENCLKISSCAAAIAVSRPGAAPAIPVRSEVLEGLKTMKTLALDKKKQNFLMSLDKYVSENLKNASIKELSQLFGYSEVYTGNLIKKHTGKTFKQYVQEVRLNTAAQLLVSSDMSVGEIIHSIGYENESYFRALFVERFSQNPLKYRNSGGINHD